jgi:hypothetical protein
MSAIRLGRLTAIGEWDALRASLDPKNRSAAVKNILEQLRNGGALSVVIEEEYLDQDFTAAYSAFYSTIFKRHTKLCRRLHFFKEDVTTAIDNARALASSVEVQEAGERSYMGFIVVRPVSHAPIGRAVLAAPVSPAGSSSEVLVRSPYEVHLLGATLKILGIAMTQQDSRVGACAQASIWMAGRHFHMRHRGPWISTVAITDAATKLTDQWISRSLPAGSEFLTPDNMLRALRTMDREPLVHMADIDPKTPTATAPWTIRWTQVRPEEIINRYLDSGIPVILGLSPLANQPVGHAVLVTGHTIQGVAAGTGLHANPTTACFCQNFLVHDDQRGSNVPVAIRAGGGSADFPYSIYDHLVYLIAPLPKKVFIAAEAAEKISWDTLRSYVNDWAAHKAAHGAALGASVATGDAFVQEFAGGRVIARTYLTYGWRYKGRMIRNGVGDDFKSVLLYHDLPRYVWVTEFGTLASLNQVEVRQRRIFSHSVIDATASGYWESRSIFHAPGMSVRRFHDPADPFGDLKDATAPVSDDRGYFPKVRGENDYSKFPAIAAAAPAAAPAPASASPAAAAQGAPSPTPNPAPAP